MANKKYTWDEIRKHASEKSCWIVIKGGVYDITKYLPEHPGGPQWILDWAGKDATEAYENKGGMGLEHSSFSHELLAKQKIGTVDDTK